MYWNTPGKTTKIVNYQLISINTNVGRFYTPTILLSIGHRSIKIFNFIFLLKIKIGSLETPQPHLLAGLAGSGFSFTGFCQICWARAAGIKIKFHDFSFTRLFNEDNGFDNYRSCRYIWIVLLFEQVIIFNKRIITCSCCFKSSNYNN